MADKIIVHIGPVVYFCIKKPKKPKKTIKTKKTIGFFENLFGLNHG
ncbi:MAG: hypothetical protein HRU29_16425 [Rhizobiales bacterium]|nr:hypothetical protein [Hyphomicrobiales bacterium]